MQASQDYRLLTGVGEAATRLGIGRTKLYNLIAAKAIKSLKVGGRRLVPVAALEQFLACLTTAQGKEQS